ncbi:carbon storage regulator CsrA [Haloimpatiens massiliensis]|uniref:carbon storage regulator CsrA n=1 Tax=Haloimpatiens massiliensis TaxID=1658110 RepID=UPI000C855335|nr:carbon storage regulator CsrA [Haloimpatiens massiliensis]
MLVVKRKKGEAIVLGEDIEISVVDIDGGSVKIAIKAPKEVAILRKELLKEVEEENKSALNFNIDILKNLKK